MNNISLMEQPGSKKHVAGLPQRSRPRFTKILSGILVPFSLSLPASASDPASLILEGDRIVIVGDSITGHSAGGNGFTGLLQEALEKAYPGTKTTVTPLGGSGMGIGSWVGTERDSREKSIILDVPNVDVKATLDAGAEVIIIKLGMNNVLRPDMDSTSESVASWAATYRTLIASLRERTHARVIAVATPTMCTEDEGSVKNLLLDDMSNSLVEIAAMDDCIVLPVRENFKKMLKEGRTYRPDYHLTDDFVHPNSAGHLAIATAMLEGLGETAAAKAMNEERSPKIWEDAANGLPALSYTLEVAPPAVPATDEATIKVRFWLTTELPRPEKSPAKVQLAVPEGWSVTPAIVDASTGEFTLKGPLNRLRNVFSLSASHDNQVTKKEVMIPAPWLIGVGGTGRTGWMDQQGFKFDPVEGHLPIDDNMIRGVGFGEPVTNPVFAKKITWKRYIASVDYTGGNDPASVDITAVDWFGTFDVAYGVRWIYSPTDRTVPVKIDSHAFAGGQYVSAWVNGANIWQSFERSGDAELKLSKGWNVLVFKSNHLEWQWQFEIHLLPTATDNLNDLRFSILPQSNENLPAR